MQTRLARTSPAQGHRARRAGRGGGRRHVAPGRPPIERKPDHAGGPMSPGEVMALQRLVGNGAVSSAIAGGGPIQRSPATIQRFKRPFKKKQKSLDKLEEVKKGAGAREKPPPAKKDTRVQDEAGVASTVLSTANAPLGVAGGTIGQFALQTPKLGDLKEEGQSDEDYDKDKLQFGDGTSQTALGITSTATGVVGSSLSGMAGFAEMVKLWQDSSNQEGTLDNVIMKIMAVGKGTQGGLSLATAGGQGTALVGQGVSAAGGEAGDLATGAFGATAGLGALSSAVDVVVGSIKMGKQGYEIYKKGASKARFLEIATEFLKTLKSLISALGSAMSSVSKFVSIAGKFEAFTNAVPVAGAAVNIAVQLIDIVLQIINAAKAVYRMVKAKVRAKKMLAQAAKVVVEGKGKMLRTTGRQKQMLEDMAAVNMKRYKRAILPLTTALVNAFADGISICGSILNIIGVASSAAYGAGVGLMAAGYGASATAGIMKAGTAAAAPIAKLTRWSKQKGRDIGAKNPQGRVGKRAAKLFNTQKSTENKQKQYVQDAKAVVNMLVMLPMTVHSNEDRVKYEDAYDVLTATGVSKKKLFAEKDIGRQFRMLVDAMKVRE